MTSPTIRDARRRRAHSRSFGKVAVPTFAEVVQWAKKAKLGLVVEMKERERPDELSDRVLSVPPQDRRFGNVSLLSFNHVDLLSQGEGARRPDRGDRPCAPRRPSRRPARLQGRFGLDRARDVCPEDAKSCTTPAFTIASIARARQLAPYWAHGRDPQDAIGGWLSAGLIDSLSGDDVIFLASWSITIRSKDRPPASAAPPPELGHGVAADDPYIATTASKRFKRWGGPRPARPMPRRKPLISLGSDVENTLMRQHGRNGWATVHGD